jgi:flagellar biosynthesis protein FlhF
MRLKSYFAGTVESAICLARQELGEDAMLVNSRKTHPEDRHLGAYEVVFAASQEPAQVAAAARAAAQPQEAPPVSAVPALAQEMAEMRKQIARLSTLVSRSSVGGARRNTALSPALDELDRTLAAHEVDGVLADSILRNLEKLGAAATSAEVTQAFRREIQGRLPVSAELTSHSLEPGASPGAASAHAVVALVGPPGAGKTAMLAKLAVRYGISSRRSTHILAYDGHRIAASEQLRSYAAILGVGFEALETVTSLAQSLRENSRKELILIDTPGYSAADFDLSRELAQFLSTYPHADIHLVLSCGAKSSDISRMVDRYNVFGPAKLLFTRLDETDSYGAILNESIRTGLPVSFLGAGPRVPDDVEPAIPDSIINLFVGGRESWAVATA